MELNWTQVITNLMLISGGSVVLVKGIDALYKYFDKKKNKLLQDSVEKLKDDLEETKKTVMGNKDWIDKLADDVDYIIKLLLNKK